MSAATPSLSFAPYDRLPAAQRTRSWSARSLRCTRRRWGLLQMREVRDAVAEAAPLFVSLIAPARPSRSDRAAAAAAPQPPTPREPAAAGLVAATPARRRRRRSWCRRRRREPSSRRAPAPARPVVAATRRRAPAPPPAPKMIPASAVQYLEPLVLEYPRAVEAQRRDRPRADSRLHRRSRPRRRTCRSTAAPAIRASTRPRSPRCSRRASSPTPRTASRSPAGPSFPFDFELEK